MTEIKVNRKKNLCYIRLSGYMDSAEIIDAKNRAIRAFDALEPNMIIINDITEFRPVRQELALHISEAQKHAFQKGVNKVIRIVDNPLSKMQFNHTQQRSDAGYQTIEVANLDQAMEIVEAELQT